MQEAQEKLEEAQREGAVEKQEEAIRELEQAKAELEDDLQNVCFDEHLPRRKVELLQSTANGLPLLLRGLHDDEVVDLVGNDADAALGRCRISRCFGAQ